ncbi:MAG: hypothetical protein WC919_08045 [Candidatus Paceibacterota bacterium]
MKIYRKSRTFELTSNVEVGGILSVADDVFEHRLLGRFQAFDPRDDLRFACIGKTTVPEKGGSVLVTHGAGKSDRDL